MRYPKRPTERFTSTKPSRIELLGRGQRRRQDVDFARSIEPFALDLRGGDYERRRVIAKIY